MLRRCTATTWSAPIGAEWIERRHEDIDAGLARLANSFTRHQGAEPETLADALLADLIPPTGVTDNSALVALRLQRKRPPWRSPRVAGHPAGNRPGRSRVRRPDRSRGGRTCWASAS